MSNLAKKASQKSTVAGLLGVLATLIGFSQGIIDPLSGVISGIANLYLIIVDEK